MKTTSKTARLLIALAVAALCIGAMSPRAGVIAGGRQASGGGPTDPSYSSVSLLLHMNGADTSTTFTDNSPSPKTVTANGNAQIDTAQSQFGGASGLFDGTGDYLTVPDNTAFEMGSGDFTIELWVRFANVVGNKMCVVKRSTSAGFGPFAIMAQGTALRLWLGSTDTSWDVVNASTIGTVAANTWYHVAITRSGTTIRKFLAGVKNGTDVTSSAALVDNSAALVIGGDTDGGYHNGWIDDLRITKGVCRYTANFTPPAAQFPDS